MFQSTTTVDFTTAAIALGTGARTHAVRKVARMLMKLPVALGIGSILVIGSSVLATAPPFSGSMFARVASGTLLAIAIFSPGLAVSRRARR